jgi:hypothetical protein
VIKKTIINFFSKINDYICLGNNKKEVVVETASKTLSGVKILFTKTNAKFNGLSVYGIEELKVNSGAKPVSYKKCTDNNGGQNRWFLDDASFVDVGTSPRVRAEMAILLSYTNRLLDLLNILVQWPPKVVKMIEKGVYICLGKNFKR